MLPKDLFKKVRRIQITTSRMATDVFAGQYHSVFKGRGVEFDEVREYQYGDDVRSIDWNVTARTGIPHIKKYVEERELTVMLLIDVSQSSQFGTVNVLKNRLAAEVAALLAFSAIRNNDKVGLVIFTDMIEKFIPPQKGIKNVLRVIREILYFQPKHRATHIAQALEYLRKVTTRSTVSFLISDFYEQDADAANGGFEQTRLKKAMTIAAKRHDLIAVTLNDPREMDLPACGLVTLQDAENGKRIIVDTDDARVREDYRRRAEARLRARKRLFYSSGVDDIDIFTDRPYDREMVKFFANRRRRIR